MRLLQTKTSPKPLGEFKALPKQDLAKLLAKEKDSTRIEALEYAKELQDKLATLEKVSQSFQKSEKEVEEQLILLTKKAREALKESEGLSGLIKEEFKVSKEEVGEKIKLLEGVSEEAENKHIQLLSQKEEIEDSLKVLLRMIKDSTYFVGIAKAGEEEFAKKKASVHNAIHDIEREHGKFVKTQEQSRNYLQKEFTRLSELLGTIQAEKINFVSAKGQLEKLEEHISSWQNDLEQREKELLPKAKKGAEELRILLDNCAKDFDVLESKFKRLEGLKQKLAEASDVFLQEKAEAEKIKKESEVSQESARTAWDELLEESKKKEKEIRQSQKNITLDQEGLQSASEAFKQAQDAFEAGKVEIANAVEEFGETKIRAKEEIQVLSEATKAMYNSLEKKIVELKEQDAISSSASKELIEVKNIANGYLVLAEKKKKEIIELQEKEKAYFDKRKQEIEEAGQILLQDKLQIQAAKKQFVKAEENFKEWERRLKDYQSALHSTYKELKQTHG